MRFLRGGSRRAYFDSCTEGFVSGVRSRKRRHGTGGCGLTIGRLRQCVNAAGVVFDVLAASILAR